MRSWPERADQQSDNRTAELGWLRSDRDSNIVNFNRDTLNELQERTQLHAVQ